MAEKYKKIIPDMDVNPKKDSHEDDRAVVTDIEKLIEPPEKPAKDNAITVA